MKFYKTIHEAEVNSVEMLDALKELNTKKFEVTESLAEERRQVFLLQQKSFEGENVESELRKKEAEVIDFQFKLDSLEQLKESFRDRILKKLNEERQTKLAEIQKGIKELRETSKKYEVEIIRGKAFLSVMAWFLHGLPINPPHPVTPEQREIFSDEIKKVKKQKGFGPETKPIKAQITQLQVDFGAAQEQVIDMEYFERLMEGKK